MMAKLSSQLDNIYHPALDTDGTETLFQWQAAVGRKDSGLSWHLNTTWSLTHMANEHNKFYLYITVLFLFSWSFLILSTQSSFFLCVEEKHPYSIMWETLRLPLGMMCTGWCVMLVCSTDRAGL